ncbi:hypothetical protein GCM10011585_23170 [Edaphobacter dinghuensis]|uniref:Uncharacterized protein n=1 Tax=Edaphobacter dinghuensis TaxID=1560005 RepID=A0A917M519_9BACT|nr:hypothetical protein GCM10011585_23170 [Edaphobacter dinghuensis]
MKLAAEVIDDPEHKAEEDAEQEAGDEREGDRPAAAAPVEVAGKAAQRDVEAVETQNCQPRDDEEKAKEDKDAAKVRHQNQDRLIS